MLLFSRIAPVIVFTIIVVQCVHGYQRIVHIDEAPATSRPTTVPVPVPTAGLPGRTTGLPRPVTPPTDGLPDVIQSFCCHFGHCTCISFPRALIYLTSDVLLNITSDVVLNSFIHVSNLVNVVIIGHNNPTVNCIGAGGIHFISCRNCIIQGITWRRCGSDNKESEPGLKLTYSFKITIQNCVFQYSRGQTIAISDSLGYVNISECKFHNNDHYEGHGAILNIISSIGTLQSSNEMDQILLKIQHCNFVHNRAATSLVYIENRIPEHNDIMFLNATFSHNLGVSIYALNQKVYINGNTVFQSNIAIDGAGILISNHSAVIFGGNSNVVFFNNSAHYKGGAVLSRNHSIVIFDLNSKVTFTKNCATDGIIYLKDHSNVLFKEACTVMFSKNSARQCGAAIFSNNSNITFTENSSVIFSANTLPNHHVDSDFMAEQTPFNHGGAICNYYGHITFEGNSITKFSENKANNSGAIFSSHGHIIFKENSSTNFNNNSASWYGGAIHSDYGDITFKDKSATEFTNNNAMYAGAIYSYKLHIVFKDNSITKFIENSAKYHSGAIRSLYSHIVLEGNSTTEFSINSAMNSYGGSVSLYYGDAIFKDTSTSVFSHNMAGSNGGAFNAYHGSIAFEGNSIAQFNENTANYFGGAIQSFRGDVSFDGAPSTDFNNNYANQGGAISVHGGKITFKDYSTTAFNNNFAEEGGGIYLYNYSYITFQDESKTILSNVITARKNDVIIAKSNAIITFDDKSTVSFINNKSIFDATVYPISIFNSTIIARRSFIAIFNGQSAKWCTNTCIPYPNNYTGKADISVDYIGTVWCSNEKGFICESRKCQCKNLEDMLVNIENGSLAKLPNKIKLSSVIKLRHLQSISITGRNDVVVICNNGGGLQLEFCSSLTFQGISWIGCGTVLKIYHSRDILIKKCSFHSSKGQAIALSEPSGEVSLSYCKFMHSNHHGGHGAAISYSSNDPSAVLIIKSCNFSFNTLSKSVIYINQSDQHTAYYLNNSTFYNNRGVSIYLSKTHSLYIGGEVSFENNSAENGPAIYINDYSTVTFGGKSTVKFINNSADHYGAAILLTNHSSIIFDKNSMVYLSDNYATNGTIFSEDSSVVTFKANCEVTFNSNRARQYGAAIHARNNSHIVFTGSSNVIFSKNIIPTSNSDLQLGGIILAEKYCNVSFEGKSATTFSNNTADFGAGILSLDNSVVTFRNQSRVVFNDNIVVHCGVLTSSFSSVSFNDNTNVIYNANKLSCPSNNCFTPSAGAICSLQGTDITLSGHSSVTFIDNSAVHGNGAIMFSESVFIVQEHASITFKNNIAQLASGGALASYNSVILIKGNSHVTFTGNKASQSGGAVFLHNMSLIIFTDNSTSTFANNTARNNGGAILNDQPSEITFEGNSRAIFEQNKADNGGTFYCTNTTITFKEKSVTSFYNNVAKQSGGVGYFNNCDVVFEETSFITFNKNMAEENGGVLFSISSSILFKGNSYITFTYNGALNGGTISAKDHSTITSKESAVLSFEGNEAVHKGGAVYVANSSKVVINERSVITFNNNTAKQNGGVLHFISSALMIKGNSSVLLNYNEAMLNGGAMSAINSSISISGFTDITICKNRAVYGGAILVNNHSSIIITGNSVLSFHSNEAREGGAIHVSYMCTFIFKENSTSSFMNNHAYTNGGSILCQTFSVIEFLGKSQVTFSSNVASNGGSLYAANSTTITFNGNSVIGFNNNSARHSGGVLHSINSLVEFKGNSAVLLSYNEAMLNGGAMCYIDSNIYFFGFTNLTFYKNRAVYGGALLANDQSNIAVTGNSVLTLHSNEAIEGGALHVSNMCTITFDENSKSSFMNNRAKDHGGSILSTIHSDITFLGKSVVLFSNNTATDGGSLYAANSTTVIFNDNSVTMFNSNKATENGGGLYGMRSTVMFKGNSTLTLSGNKAFHNGGAVYSTIALNVSILEFANVTFKKNSAINGGAVCITNNSYLLFEDDARIRFFRNTAEQSGGSGYCSMHSNLTMKGNSNVIFENNIARYGGAVYSNENTGTIIEDNAAAIFNNNMANIDGGAINIYSNSSVILKDYAIISFTTNSAQYGGAMFFDASHSTLILHNHKRNIGFLNNAARITGKAVYFDLNKSCNRSCLSNRIRINGVMNGIKYYDLIATPPSKLKFYDPAICIGNNATVDCDTYLMSHVMLGQEINIPTCVLNHFDRPTDTTQFLLYQDSDPNYSMNGSNQVLLSCDAFRGISIIGNKSLSKPHNYSINVVLHDDRNSGWEEIAVNLTIELTPCYPGFWQYSGSQRCECYNASDIVFCSGSTSTIKRGYWFGSIMEKPTVTFCPINYCNFTCCETSNGYYHLSPLRDNQCRSHRIGPACGSCKDGYTLSFDSTECVDVDNCTAGQTVLVILLTVIYWIVMFTLVFAIMYYKVGIGYLYSITYYYSIVDILLSQIMHASRGFYLTTNIISSFSKITPQFLGELCLTTGMSGIDQKFIHYIHPLAVILILVFISLLARRSRRISTIISRGIIHVICLLLLISYTSIASTSLLLMRPLNFLGIDKVYTYLSPDIEYLHGRHLAYAIVGMLCTVSIVIGLPLLLTLEPFLNHKINFIKIKPFLDQFQGCYKDNLRYFAGYYMICRLIIIVIVVVNSSNDFVANYMLIIVCGTIALVHGMVRPYSNEILNKFDGIILHLIIFTALLPWLDDFTSLSVIIMAYILIILPLLSFTAMTLFLHKNDLKKIFTRFTAKFKISNKSNKSNNNGIEESKTPQSKFHFITDGNNRTNTTTCDM